MCFFRLNDSFVSVDKGEDDWITSCYTIMGRCYKFRGKPEYGQDSWAYEPVKIRLTGVDIDWLARFPLN